MMANKNKKYKMKTEIEKKKDALRKELDALNKQEMEALIEKHYPLIKERFEGKYFKTQNAYNSRHKWWRYVKVAEIKSDGVYDTHGNGVTAVFNGYSFEKTTSNEVVINQVKGGYVHSLDIEITEKEFNEAWNKIIGYVNTLA